jgi:hypothetical protein
VRNPVEIENIEGRRLQVGIDDVELREEIRGLHVGDSVNLTFLPGAGPFGDETLLVRITRIRGPAFRSTVATKPASVGLSKLWVGSTVPFTATHIHSLQRGRSKHEQ